MQVTCGNCRGSGECPRCRGTGDQLNIVCPACDGSALCRACAGKGLREVQETQARYDPMAAVPEAVKQEVAGRAENSMHFEVWKRVRRWLEDSGIEFEELEGGGPGATLKPGSIVSSYGMGCYVEPLTISMAVVRFHGMIGRMREIDANSLALRWILIQNYKHIMGALAVNVDGWVTFKYDIFASGMTRTHFVQAFASMNAWLPRVRNELPGVCNPGTFSLINEA
jgi:hypothetical protein